MQKCGGGKMCPKKREKEKAKELRTKTREQVRETGKERQARPRGWRNNISKSRGEERRKKKNNYDATKGAEEASVNTWSSNELYINWGGGGTEQASVNSGLATE